MLTVLGLISICGAIFFGMSSADFKAKGPGVVMLFLINTIGTISASIACLYCAFLCFGGTL